MIGAVGTCEAVESEAVPSGTSVRLALARPEPFPADQLLRYQKISAHNNAVRRRQGAVLPLEAAILAAAVEFSASGTQRFHGFLLAKHLRDGEGAKLLTAHGTLYKALGRMEKAGWLTSRWEDPEAAAAEGRPRRRCYAITSAGRTVLAEVAAKADAEAIPFDPGWSAT